jgi:hypothetical protein
MKNLYLIILLFLFSFPLHAQAPSDTIQIHLRQVNQFYFQSKKLKPNDMLYLTKSNPEAYRTMRSAKNSYGAAQFFGFAGGFIIGWQLGRVITKQPAPWSVTLIGAGAIIASIPFNNSYSNHATNAVRIYNRDLQKSVGMQRAILDFGVTSSGMGFQLTY